ncbi:MAG TPA: hypothetical protein VFH10_00845 [Nocardioides sp.]|nr:hypothetical protein [Nocardioides sp.]HET6651158.1 hypothetical protein [Nocardioides sp.]
MATSRRHPRPQVIDPPLEHGASRRLAGDLQEVVNLVLDVVAFP